MRTTTYPNATVERSGSQSGGPTTSSLTKTIPFDYVFEFKLKGKDPNNVQDVVKLQDVVEISMQGVFVAVSLGYGFVLDESKIPTQIPIVIDQNSTPSTAPVILRLPSDEGEPRKVLIAGTPNSDMTILRFMQLLKQRVVFGETTSFRGLEVPLNEGERDVITTSETGIATVTIADGNENFGGSRLWDRATNLISQVLQSGVVGPHPSTGALPKIGDNTTYIYGDPQQIANVLLLEHSTGNSLQLLSETGSPNFTITENGWVEVKLLVRAAPGDPPVERRLSAGDLLMVDITELVLNQPPSLFAVPGPRVSDVSLGDLFKGLATANTRTIRLTARLSNILQANPPIGGLSRDIFANAFEPAAGPEDISFLYSIDIVSSGRELQNKPIHNIAGLGIANGDRPFRPFARPIAFEPRSVIRIQIEELSTLPGTLYIVLQGYKTLGTGRIPE